MDFDSDNAIIEKAGFCIVLCSRDEPYVLNENADLFASKSTNLLVYAESIELSGSIKLPGKTLALICQNLSLSGSTNVVLDVSGTNGGLKPAVAVGNGAKGDDGQAAGTIFVSVENSAADLSKLQVRAIGGDGGQGGATSDPKKISKGGDGGKGGNSGKITLLFNNKVHDVNSLLQQKISQAQTASWFEKCLIAKDILSNQQLSLSSTTAIDFLAAFGKSVKAYSSSIQDQPQFAQRLLQELRGSLKQYSQLDSYATLTRILESPSNSKTQLEASLSVSPKRSLEACALELSNQEDNLRDSLSAKFSCSVGRGGRGGTGSSDLDSVGARGTDGTSVQKAAGQCRYLPGLGDDFYSDLELPTFFPDEARMLLKRADAQFFRNTSESLVIAKQFYERLIRRLYFVPLLDSSVNSSTPITQFFKMSIEKNTICIAPISELKGVLEEAKTRLARIELGQDIFGQGPSWAPRLSYFYYEKRIEEMIGNFKDLATQLDAYKAKSDKADERREAVGNVRDMVKKEGASVQSRLDSILDENGPIRATAYRIRTYDPLMKDQQRWLKTQMDSVAGQIKSSINVSKVIDAFTTMAKTKSKIDAAKNAVKAGYNLYQAVTVVDDADGNSIDKALLVKQVTTCGDTIESLQQAISANSDGSVALEDPGAVKVVTSKENISKILDQFRNILPENMRNTTNKQLDDFLETVNTRNDAVLEYNSLSQLVQELQSTKRQQAVMIDALSQQQLQKVDPGLPSIVNWLRRTRDDLSLTIMQQLNYASRAICYWGLVEGLPLNEPGPLRGATELTQIQKKLKESFDVCLNDYAGSAWDWWPTGSSWGRLYELNTVQLSQLKNGTVKDEKGKAVYSTNIALSPDSAGMAGVGSNVRIKQIRLWLANANVDVAADGSDRRILTITLSHTGNELIQKNDKKSFTFAHSPVKINFRYHCGGVKSLQDAKTTAVFGQQIIENDYQNPTVSSNNASAIAPLGPFTLWTATIREKDNPGLDLTKVDRAWLEFWGRSKPM